MVGVCTFYCEDTKNYVSCAGYVVVCAMLVDGWGMYILLWRQKELCQPCRVCGCLCHVRWWLGYVHLLWRQKELCQLRRVCGCVCHISSCAVESVPDWSGHQRDCEERKECDSCAGYVGCAMLLLICFGINASFICGINIIVKEEGNMSVCVCVCACLFLFIFCHTFFFFFSSVVMRLEPFVYLDSDHSEVVDLSAHNFMVIEFLNTVFL